MLMRDESSNAGMSSIVPQSPKNVKSNATSSRAVTTARHGTTIATMVPNATACSMASVALRRLSVLPNARKTFALTARRTAVALRGRLAQGRERRRSMMA